MSNLTRQASEKSNFAQTCNLLSQYMKERGTFGDIGLGMTGKLEAKGVETSRPPPAAATMSLLRNMENSFETYRPNTVAPSNIIKSMDFFPQFASFGSSTSIQDPPHTNADARKPPTMEPGSGSAQMTIFYGGQVLVFNEFPADKATEVMALASSGSFNTTSSGFVSANSGTDKINSGDFVACDSSIASTSGSKVSQEHLRHQSHPIDSDLPIARRASLHRFLAKRKDRATARAPYQVNNPSATPPKPEESNPWLDLEGPFSKQLDLKLW